MAETSELQPPAAARDQVSLRFAGGRIDMPDVVAKLDVTELVRAATLAPSPDNNQPWRFVAAASHLDVFLDPERALPSDVNSMFDLTGIGTAIENLCIAARQQGYEAAVQILNPAQKGLGPSDAAHVARITWTPREGRDALAPYLATRQTCRNPFSSRPLELELRQELEQEATAFPGVKVHWLAERPQIKQFGWLIGKSDRLRFERKSFHAELFKQLRFTPEAAALTRDGLDLRTLGLPPGGPLLLRLISSWRVLQFMNSLGASRCLALPGVMTVRQSGAIGLITVPQPARMSLVAGGRAFQRLWLAATRRGLQLHPLGSLPIFLAHLDQLGGAELTPAQQRLAQSLQQQLMRLVPDAAHETLQIAFRLGYGKQSPCRSLRRDVGDVLAQQ